MVLWGSGVVIMVFAHASAGSGMPLALPGPRQMTRGRHLCSLATGGGPERLGSVPSAWDITLERLRVRSGLSFWKMLLSVLGLVLVIPLLSVQEALSRLYPRPVFVRFIIGKLNQGLR